MPKRKIDPNSDTGFLGESKTYKSKPKPYIQSEYVTNYLKERDRCLWREHPELRKELEEKYGNIK